LKKKLIISDYGWIHYPIEESWISETELDYLILDKKHRLPINNKIVHQKNVGQNIYDIFDYIYKNYENLEDVLIFCRGCIMYPKNRSKPLSNGNCSKNKFFRLIKKNDFTEIHDYENEYQDGISAYIGNDGGYYEINRPWYLKKHRPKYFYSLNSFMNFFFKNYHKLKYVRFSPGGSYIINKERIYFYPKEFYLKIKEILSWGIVIGDAHILERSLFLIFSNEYYYKKRNYLHLLYYQAKTFCVYWFFYFLSELLISNAKRLFPK